MAVSDSTLVDKPSTFDLDHCVHCGLCLNACPTYRELGVEMDSPAGACIKWCRCQRERPQSASLTSSTSGCVWHAADARPPARPGEYGRLVEAARAEIENNIQRPWGTRVMRNFAFRRLLPSRNALRLAGAGMYAYQKLGLRKVGRALGILRGRLGELEALAPVAQRPFFYRYYGKTMPAGGNSPLSRRTAWRVHRECQLCPAE